MTKETISEECLLRLRVGVATRLFVTLGLIYVVRKYYSHSKYLLLILFFKALAIDTTDTLFAFFYKGISTCWNDCPRSLLYDVIDNSLHLITYYLIYQMLHHNSTVGFFIGLRILGFILFYPTQNRKWMIPFFNFIKEYLLYEYIFGKNLTYFPIVMIGKIAVDYYLHIHSLSKSCFKKDETNK